MRSIAGICLGISLVVGAGCGGTVKEEVIQVAAPTDPLAEVKSVLQRYANGALPSSEVTMYPALVDQLRKVDPAKADLLQKGLDAIQKSPQSAPAKAKELLKQL